jgi:hypothetical protein
MITQISFIILSLLISTVFVQGIVNGQGLSDYENPKMGIKISYPEYLELIDSSKDCGDDFRCNVVLLPNELKFNDTFMVTLTIDGVGSPFHKAEGCVCSNLADYMRWDYAKGLFDGQTFINDNQTTVNSNHPAWQMEHEDIANGKFEKILTVYTMNDNTGYKFRYSIANDKYNQYLPVFRQILDSVIFSHPTKSIPTLPKQPSFLNWGNATHSPINQTDDKPIQILSKNSYISATGSLHILGEVKNNTPNTIEFVKLVGTFYDGANQVVATDFTYTSPTDRPGRYSPI